MSDKPNNCSEAIFSDEDTMDYGYYNMTEDCEPDSSTTQTEFLEYECLTVQEVNTLLNESVETVTKVLKITPSLAKVVLHVHSWKLEEVISKYLSDSSKLLEDFKIKPGQPVPAIECSTNVNHVCPVCCIPNTTNKVRSLTCEHLFCDDCWENYFEIQIKEGKATNIKCMAQKCEMLAPEDFVLALLKLPSMLDKYQQFVFRDYVKSHPQLTICPGLNCEIVIRAKKPSAKRVVCNVCRASFCFLCGNEYHAPTDCVTIGKWLIRCLEDAETATYLTTHTKCCPMCRSSIEKSGGCNHMCCHNCGHEFCWMCMKNWNTHSANVYTCSFYMENPNIVDELLQAQSRAALQKYLRYYERWQSHSNSLKLDEQRLEMIRSHIDKNIMDGSGTRVYWHSVLDATNVLFKCRRTLQYTYPYAYYEEPGPQKLLFEYQQAQMEMQLEGLARKIEMAESTDRADLLNQMYIVQKWEEALLNNFLNCDADM